MAGNAGTLLARLGLDSKNFTTGIQKAEHRARKLGKTMGQVGQNVSTRLGLPMAAVGLGASKLAIDFDKSMTQVQTLVGISGEQVNAWRDQLLELGPAVGKGPTELGDALFSITSAGARGAEALSILENSAKASAVGLGETKDVARAVVSAVQAYESQGLSAGAATDVMTAAVRAGNLEAADLAGVLGNVMGIADTMGVSFAETTAFISTFTRAGANAETATTSLSAVLGSFLKPSQGARDALEKMGLSVDTVRSAIKEDGLAVALTDLMDAFDGNLDLLGQVIPNVRALRGVLSTAASQGEDYVKIAQDIAESDGVLAEAFERTQQTFAQQAAVFRSKMEVIGEKLGRQLLPKLLQAADRFSDFVDSVSAASAQTYLMAAGLIALATALGPALMGVGLMIRSVSTLAFTVIPALFKASAALLTKVLVPMAVSLGVVGSGVLVVVVALAAVTAAFADADGKMQEFLRKIPLIGGFLDKAMTFAKSAVYSGVRGILSGLDWLVEKIENIAEKAASAFGGRFGSDSILDGVKKLRAGINTQIAGIDSDAKTNWENFKLRAEEALKSGDSNPLDTFTFSVDGLKDGLKGLNPTLDAVPPKVGEIANEFKKTGDVVEGFTLKIGEKFADATSSWFDGVLRGTRSASDALTAWKDFTVGLAGEMFSEILKEKLVFDASWKNNWEVDIPQMTQKGMDKVVGAVGAAFDWIGNALGFTSPSGGTPGSPNMTGAFAPSDWNTSGMFEAGPANYVEMLPAQAGRPDMKVEIHAPSALQSKSRETDSNGREFMKFVFEGAVDAVSADIAQGGKVSSAIQGSFGTRRTGGR